MIQIRGVQNASVLLAYYKITGTVARILSVRGAGRMYIIRFPRTDDNIYTFCLMKSMRKRRDEIRKYIHIKFR